MKSYKVLMIVVILLVLINCALLGAFWFGQQKLPGRGGPPQRVNEYLTKELKLTPAQGKAYDEMRKKHFEFTRKLNDANRGLRDKFFENIKTPVLDTAAVDALQKQIGANQALLDNATLNHFREFRSILNAEQQDKFDHIIKNAMHMMTGPPQRGRGMGPGPNGMPPPGGPGQGPPPDGPPPPPGN